MTSLESESHSTVFTRRDVGCTNAPNDDEEEVFYPTKTVLQNYNNEQSEKNLNVGKGNRRSRCVSLQSGIEGEGSTNYSPKCVGGRPSSMFETSSKDFDSAMSAIDREESDRTKTTTCPMPPSSKRRSSTGQPGSNFNRRGSSSKSPEPGSSKHRRLSISSRLNPISFEKDHASDVIVGTEILDVIEPSAFADLILSKATAHQKVGVQYLSQLAALCPDEKSPPPPSSHFCFHFWALSALF